MSSTGELNQRARRPSTPGANTQILFNNNGVDGANGILTLDTGNNGVFAVGGNVTAAVGNSVAFLNSTNGSQLLLQSRGTYYGSISNPNNQVWSLGYSSTVSNTQPTANILSWGVPWVSISDGNGLPTPNTSAYSTGGSRAVLVLQAGAAGATGGDALIAIQNSTGYLSGYIYGSNSEFRLLGATSSNTTIYGGGALMMNVTGTVVSINTPPTLAALTIGSGGECTRATATSDAPFHSFYAGGKTGADGRMGYIQMVSNSSAYFVVEQNIPIEFRVNNINTLKLNLNQANVNGSLNVSQSIFAPNCPMSNTVTGVETGLGGVMTGNSVRTSTTALTAENNLSCTLGNTGVYAVEAWFGISGSNGVNSLSGFKLGFGGTATVNALALCTHGVINGGAFANALARGTGLAANGAVTFGNTAVSTADWLLVKGVLTINTTGTFFPMYAQNLSNANSTNLQSNSYMTLTRVL